MRRQERWIIILGVVFASSPFVVMSAHLLGYFDALIYFSAIASVGLTLGNRPFLAAIVSSTTILVHESYLLLGLPLVCLASFAVVTKKDHNRSWKKHLFSLTIPVATFLFISIFQHIMIYQIDLRTQLLNHLNSFGFVGTKSENVVLWQTTSFVRLFSEQYIFFFRRVLYSIALVSPTLLTILLFIYSSFRIRLFSLFSVMMLGAVFAPYAMHAIAWDTSRIATYPIGGALIAWWIVQETRTSRQPNNAILIVGVLALIFNIFVRIPLMDDEMDRFSNLLRTLLLLPSFVLIVTIVIKIFRNHRDKIGVESVKL